MWQNLRQKVFNSLRRSEKYTKTDMVYLAKSGFWLTTSQIISSLCSLVLAIAFANLIQPELYGNYRYILSIIGILSIATFPGINTAAIKSVADGDISSFWKLATKKIFWSLATTLLSLTLSLYYYLQSNQELSLVLIIVAILLPVIQTTGIYSSFLSGQKNFRRLAQWSMISKVFASGAIIISLFFLEKLSSLILIYFLPEIIIESIFLYQLYRKNRPNRAAANINLYSNFGIHLSVMEILKTVASQIDKLLVFHYLGAAQLAIYTIASAAPGQIKSVLQNLTTLSLPKFSESTESNIRKTLPQKLFTLELVIIVLIIFYWLIAPFVFPLVFPKYIEAIFLSQVYSLSLIFFPRTFFSTAMTAHMKKNQLYAIRIIAPTARITTFAVALPFFGLWGAVVGSIVSNAITAGVYQYFFRKAFPFPDPQSQSLA